MTNDTYGSEPHDHEEAAQADHAENPVHEEPSDFEFNDPAEHVISETETDSQAGISSEMPIKQRSPLLPIAAAAGGILLLGGVALWQFGKSPTPPPMPLDSTLPSLAAAQNDASVPVTPKTGASPVEMSDSAAPAAPTSSIPPALAQQPPVAAAPAPVANGGSMDARIDALSARIDTLQKELDQSSQQLAQMTNAVAASAPETNSKDLQDRLDKIEQELTSLVSKQQAAHAKPPTHIENAVSSYPTVKHKAASKTTKKPVETAIETTHWVLRAAAPGQAWVSSNPTSSDLKEIHVGDSVPGIGRVTAIQQNNGAWIVQGTSGSLQ